MRDAAEGPLAYGLTRPWGRGQSASATTGQTRPATAACAARDTTAAMPAAPGRLDTDDPSADRNLRRQRTPRVWCSASCPALRRSVATGPCRRVRTLKAFRQRTLQRRMRADFEEMRDPSSRMAVTASAKRTVPRTFACQ